MLINVAIKMFLSQTFKNKLTVKIFPFIVSLSI